MNKNVRIEHWCESGIIFLKIELRRYFSFKVWKEGDEFPLHPSFIIYKILKLSSNASPRPPLIHSFHHVHEAVIGVHILLMLETHDANKYQDLGFWVLGTKSWSQNKWWNNPTSLSASKIPRVYPFFTQLYKLWLSN
jgi:hypothetical protein